MSRTEDLIEKSKAGDERSRELLIEENSGLIWSVARRFLGRGTDADDLFQLGCLGFLKAVEGFDLSFGTQFSTYAVPKITGEIRRFLRDDGSVKVSRSIKERAAVVRCVRSNLTYKLGREPTIQEISEQTSFTIEEIAVAETATAGPESIQQKFGDSEFSLENILTDTDTEDAIMERVLLRQAIDKLSARDATVIKLRYYHGLTQQRVAKVLKVSQVQVSRIEKKALLKLRSMIE